MITRHLGFLITSLALSQTEVARHVGVSVQHIHNVCAGRYQPSLEVAAKIEEFLKETWKARKGATVPLEVRKTVYQMLWPPAPKFDGSDEDGVYGHVAENFMTKARKGGAKAAASSRYVVSGHVAENSPTEVDDAPITQGEGGEEEGSAIIPEKLAAVSEESCGQAGSHALGNVAPGSPNEDGEGRFKRPHAEYSNPVSSAGNYASPESAALLWSRLPKTHAGTRDFFTTCLEQSWAQRWTGTDESRRDRCRRLLNKLAGGVRLRDRARCEKTKAHRDAIYDIISGALTSHRRRDAVSKGADDLHAFGSKRAVLKGVLDAYPIQLALMNSVSEIPSLEYCEKILRERMGGVNAHDEAKDHLQKTIGFRPAYDGHVILVDATGLNCKVDGAWGGKRPGERGNRNGFQKRWIYTGVDVASAHSWIGGSYSDNESDGWPDYMFWLLFNGLGYAPEHVSCDQVSGLFNDLALCKPNEFPRLHPKILTWIAAGVKPYVHQPKRPTGGAHVERSVRALKDAVATITTRKAIEKELGGAGLQKARHFSNEAELVGVLTELKKSINQRHLGRGGDTRINLWNDAESVAKRSERLLAHNAAENWKEIISRAKVASVSGSRLVLKSGSQRSFADLTAPLEFKADGAAALVLPCGLRKGDDTEAYRVLVIEPRPGQPVYHQAEAHAARVDRRGFDLAQPIFGEGFRAAGETQKDEFARERDRQKKGYEKNVTALREGTTGRPLVTNGIPTMPVAD